jgi:3-deoxy-D-manno-octulosonic-acid transferase
MHILYCLAIYLLELICYCFYLFNKKIRTMIKGQKQCFDVLRKIKKDDDIIWFHCSSLGEFEQARNLIEKHKSIYPNNKILLSFFSPSGYEIRKNYSYADFVVYLPFDTIRNAKKFLQLSHPKKVFFIKYEFWYNYIRQMKDIPLFQVSLILRDNHYLLSWYSKWFDKQLKNFNYFFVQDKKTQNILNQLGYTNSIISGDTRFDRVFQMKEEGKRFDLIEKFCDNRKIFVCGSTWKEDELMISKSINNTKMKLIIAPHLIDKAHIDFILDLFPHSITYSSLNGNNAKDYDVLIIDCIGILSYLYNYAHCCYIGGGFGEGIHNVLEAAVFGKPIAFGPNHKKFKEANDLLDKGGATMTENEDILKDYLNINENNEEKYQERCRICKEYVQNNVGATQTIIDLTKKY